MIRHSWVDYLMLALVVVPAICSVIALQLPLRQRQNAARMVISGAIITFFLSLALLVAAISEVPIRHIALGQSWGILVFDPLSTLMSFVIATISLLVQIYSRRYMIEEQGYVRFFALLGFMASALFLMVTAGDLLLLLAAWHLIGILLYLLLGHDMQSAEAHRFASWTLLTYRFGDLPLVIAALLLYQAFGTWALDDIFTRLSSAGDLRTIFNWSLTETVAALVALAAFARSAQFFVHSWLPYSMAGPTPVSALMHAGIVNAGGFLINRFAPVFLYTDSVLHWVFVVGLITAVIGSMLMLAQNDIKKALGYSTMGQMGFMIMECGLGAFSLAIFHLIAHGLFKGTLFLSAGSVINDARENDGVPKDDLYTFVVERQPAVMRRPWLLMAAVTLIVPVVVLTMAHLLVASDYFQQQGAVVLLFFGWVTGAQLIFTTYNFPTENMWRLMGLILVSFTIVVLGYAFISHAFELFLYPDPLIREGIYQKAGFDIVWFDTLVIILTLMIIVGWLAAYYTEHHGQHFKARTEKWIKQLYTLLAREFYVISFYRQLSGALLILAKRLNLWLRWY